MLTRTISDIHLEFHHPENVDDKTFIPPDDRDSETILILAGDIVLASKIMKYIHFFKGVCERFKEVIYLAGNHEYYGMGIESGDKAMQDILHSADLNNLHILNNKYVGFDNVMIFGAPLWTDMDKQNLGCIAEATRCMPEFRGHVTDEDGVRFTPDDSVRLHNESLYHLKEFFRTFDDSAPRIIVTHHAPSFESTGSIFKGSILNGAFASDLSELILEHKPNLWIHGHMHDPSDYMIGETRIICNPVGYPKEIHHDGVYNPKLFIEV